MRAGCIASSRRRAPPASSITRTSWPSTMSASMPARPTSSPNCSRGNRSAAGCRAGALPPRKAIDYARQTAEGLAAAHDKGIVHRDVKPDNLFITNDGRVKILDFGIAKLTRPSDDTGRGEPASERRRLPGWWWARRATCRRSRSAAKRVDARSDIFSLGTVLYEMLTGRPAFTRGTAAETMAAILKEDPPEPLRRRSAGARAHRLALSGEDARGAVSVGARSGVRPWSCCRGQPYRGGVPARDIGRLPRSPASWPWVVAGALAFGLALVLIRWQPWRGRAAAGAAAPQRGVGRGRLAGCNSLYRRPFGRGDVVAFVARSRRAFVAFLADKGAREEIPSSTFGDSTNCRPRRCREPTTPSVRSFPRTDSGSDFSPAAS